MCVFFECVLSAFDLFCLLINIIIHRATHLHVLILSLSHKTAAPIVHHSSHLHTHRCPHTKLRICSHNTTFHKTHTMLITAFPCVPCGNQPIKRLSTRVYAASSTAERSNHCRPVALSSTATYERILRYPDGKERRIIYPRADPTDPCEETCDTCFDETWEADHPWDIPGAQGKEENGVGGTASAITTTDPTHVQTPKVCLSTRKAS